MTPLQITIGVIVSAGSLIGATAGTIQLADQRYAPMAAFEDVQWTSLKNSIREVRKQLALTPDDQRLKDELADLIDRLCKAFPEDRECKE
jgi:hypothetical protein